MRTVTVLGAGASGTMAALQLARRGWAVTIIEPELDLVGVFDEATPQRAGAPHVCMAHALLGRVHSELRSRLPDVYDAVVAAGARELSMADVRPPGLMGKPLPASDSPVMLQTRRMVLDVVMTTALRDEPNITALRARPAGLVLSPGDPPAVVGVRLPDGTTLRSDLVVDAAGRRSPVARWLADAGVEEPLEKWSCQLAYYGRTYQVVRDGERPRLTNGFGTRAEFPSLSLVLFPGDGDTYQVALCAHSTDVPFKSLRHEDVFEAMVSAVPAFAAWQPLWTPLTPVQCMGSVQNTLRRMVIEGRPQVLGIHHVGDALAVTNPNRGRGIAMSWAAIGVLVDLLDRHPEDPFACAVALDEWVERVLSVYFRESAEWDRDRSQQMLAARRGEAGPTPVPGIETAGAPGMPTSMDLLRAATLDPIVWSAVMKAQACLDDDRSINDPALLAHVRQVLASAPPPEPPPPSVGPDRAAMIDLLASPTGVSSA